MHFVFGLQGDYVVNIVKAVGTLRIDYTSVGPRNIKNHILN